jgi:ribosomal protein S18 acetylase RimI-like enzyme
MSELVRPATKDDCRVLAYHAYLAGKSHLATSGYDHMFPGLAGPTDQRLTLMESLLQTDTVSWMHYSFCSVAEIEDQVGASLCHYHNRDGAYEKIGPALMELGWDKEDLLGMMRRMQPLLDVEFDPEGDVMMIENVAVSPKFRRRGLVNALMEDAIGIARDGGFSAIQLALFMGNAPAQKAYEKVGLKVVDEKTDPAFQELMGTPGMQLMRLDL